VENNKGLSPTFFVTQVPRVCPLPNRLRHRFIRFVTKYVITLFVTTVFVVLELVLTLRHYTLHVSYGNPVCLWKNCDRKKLYGPRKRNGLFGSKLCVAHQHDNHFATPMGQKFVGA
ncbi:MAG: hypothetical protein ACI4V2_01850, partial [Alloprevotella sp.]